jgi:hypothetical protein
MELPPIMPPIIEGTYIWIWLVLLGWFAAVHVFTAANPDEWLGLVATWSWTVQSLCMVRVYLNNRWKASGGPP